MSIKVKNNALVNQSLLMTLQKLGSVQLPVKAAYRVKKFLDAANSAVDQIRKDYGKNVAEKFGVVDEKGIVLPEKDSDFGFKLKEGVNVEDVKAAIKAFDETEVVIDQYPLTFADLGNTTLSAQEMKALDGFLVDASNEGVQDNVKPLRA